MLNSILPENLFIFDIETVPGKKHYDDLAPELQKLFDDKVGRLRKEEEDKNEFYFSKAGIFAEFGKVVCISCGYIQKKEDEFILKIKTYKGDDEKLLLEEFSQTLQNVFKNNYFLCGHNIKEFDVPWLCRRFLINGLPLPSVLDIYGKKPWETNFIDTLELWKFGDFKHYTSLNLLTNILNIPTPKDKMDGSMVGAAYWNNNDLSGIAEYCGKDVVAVAHVIMRLKGLDLIREENIALV